MMIQWGGVQQPVIESVSKNATVLKGTSLSLVVVAKSTDGGELSYQWYSASSADSEGAKIDGATSASYSFISSGTTGYYYVVVTNTKDGKSAETKSVVIAVTITENPEDVSLVIVTVDAGDGLFADGKNTATFSVVPGESLAAIIKDIGLPLITENGETRFADCFLDKESADDPDFHEWNFDYAGLLWSPIEEESTFVAQYNSISSHHVEFYNKNADDPQNAWDLLYQNLMADDDGYFAVLSVPERGQKFRITSKWCTFFYGDGTAPAALKLGEPAVLKPVLHGGDDTVGGTLDVEPGVYKLDIAVQRDGSLKAELNALPDEPYAGEYVYIVGGITESTLESGGEEMDSVFSGSRVWKIPVSNGAFSFEFTYGGKDTWAGGYGSHVFTILSNIDNGWVPDFRWGGDADISAGSEGTLLREENVNIVIRRLVVGERYTVSGKLQPYSGTLSVTTDGELLPTMNLVVAGQEPVEMTQIFGSAFEYVVPALPSAGTVQFCINYGDKWWGGPQQLTVGNTLTVPVSSSKPASNIIFAREANTTYAVRIVYDEASEDIEIRVSDGSILGFAGVIGGFDGWAKSVPFTKVDDKTYTYDFTANATEIEFAIQEQAGSWSVGRWFKGIPADTADRKKTDICDDIVAAKKGAVPKAVTPIYYQGDSGNDGKNLLITGLPYESGYQFRLTATIVDAGAKKISLTVQALEDIPDADFVKPDSQYKADGISWICSNYGNYEIAWGEKKSDGSYEGVATIPEGAKNSWGGNGTDDIDFGVTVGDGDWSTKYVDGVLAAVGTSVKLTKNGSTNNKITGVNPSEAAVVITVISTEDSISAKYSQ